MSTVAFLPIDFKENGKNRLLIVLFKCLTLEKLSQSSKCTHGSKCPAQIWGCPHTVIGPGPHSSPQVPSLSSPTRLQDAIPCLATGPTKPGPTLLADVQLGLGPFLSPIPGPCLTLFCLMRPKPWSQHPTPIRREVPNAWGRVCPWLPHSLPFLWLGRIDPYCQSLPGCSRDTLLPPVHGPYRPLMDFRFISIAHVALFYSLSLHFKLLC